MEQTVARKPEPSAGQVWSSPFTPGALYVIESANADRVTFFDEAGWTEPSRMRADWSCVGIETPHGRVMVGERRKAPHEIVTVSKVLSDQAVGLRSENGGVWSGLASEVAQWPLVPGPLSVAAKEAQRDPGPIDRLRMACARALSYGDPSNVRMEADERTGRISFFVRHGDVAPHVLRAAATIVREHVPLGITVGIFVDPPPDPRAAHEQRRREIDRNLDGEPLAIRCAVLAACERHEPTIQDLGIFALVELPAYEAACARGMRPERARQEVWSEEQLISWGWRAAGLAAYERARAVP